MASVGGVDARRDNPYLRRLNMDELVITAGVDKDEDPENDAWRMVFYQNENA